MATENNNPESDTPCDPDDVVCQTEVLERLKQFKEIAGGNAFLEKYPQLEGLDMAQIEEDVRNQEAVVKQTIENCATEVQEETELEPVSAEEVPQDA